MVPSNGQASNIPPQGARRWKLVRELDGVAVYEEEFSTDGSGGALMVSATLSSTPKNCMKALLNQQSDVAWAPASCLFENMKLIKQLDQNTRIVKGRLRAVSGLATSLCGPREAVLESSWRKEGDGTYMVLLRTTDQLEDSRLQECNISPSVTIVKDLLCGLTVSPGATYAECLVTAILQVDLGGWLSKKSKLSRLMSSTSLAWREGFISCLLTTILTLRQQVEQLSRSLSSASVSHQHHVTQPTIQQAERFEATAATTDSPAPNSDANRLDVDSSEADFDNASTSEAGADMSDVPSPGTLPQRFWSCPGSGKFKIRGHTYLLDQKKIKAAEPACTLASMDLLKLEKPMFHIARFLPNIRNSPAPFTFVIQLMVPGRPAYSATMAWAADYDPYAEPPPPSLPPRTLSRSSSDMVAQGGSPPAPARLQGTSSGGHEGLAGGRPPRIPRSSSASSIGFERSRSSGTLSSVDGAGEDAGEGAHQAGAASAAFKRCLARFLADEAGNDKQRNSRFKIIPNIVEGSWIVRQAVGNTPALLGNKLTTKYFRGPNYFEVDVDIGSSATAQSIVSLAISATKGLVVDMAFVLEGKCAEELPEQLLGTVRLHRLDMEAAVYMDTDSGGLVYM